MGAFLGEWKRKRETPIRVLGFRFFFGDAVHA